MLLRSLNKAIIPLIIGLVLWSSANIQWGGDKWKDIIEADAKGYYAYLPAMFIYHDLNFGFFDSIEKKYPNPHIYYDYRVKADGGVVDKYFVGTAVALAPFFLIAHVSSSVRDGYSPLYPIFVNVAAIFYLMVALIYNKKLLKLFGAGDGAVSIILVAIVFGTNIFYYTVCEPGMSHIYSFAFISMFLYFCKKWIAMPDARGLFILSLILGMIILIRPVNGMIVFIFPFLSGNMESIKNCLNWMSFHRIKVIAALLLCSSVAGIQCLIYQLQTGHLWVDAYPGENFNWLDPHPIDFLISYKKGLLVYTPLMLLGAFGLVVCFRKNRFKFYSLLVFFAVLLYVLSSWWNWWYGGSFGSRVSLEYFGIAVILLWIAYSELKNRIGKIVFLTFTIFCIVLCQVQTFQYRHYQIHWEKMDQEHYWRVFMRIDLLNGQNPNQDLLDQDS